jgi:hypothetical protein
MLGLLALTVKGKHQLPLYFKLLRINGLADIFPGRPRIKQVQPGLLLNSYYRLASGGPRPGTKHCGALHSIASRHPNHVCVQFNRNGTPLKDDADDRPLRGRGNNHATEAGKRTEVDGDYGSFGHFSLFAGSSLRQARGG